MLLLLWKERKQFSMRIYLATWIMEHSQEESLCKKRAGCRLLSFFFCRDESTDALSKYVQNMRREELSDESKKE